MHDPHAGPAFSQHRQHGGRQLESPYEPQLGSLPSGDRDEETVNKTGTTTIGIATDNGVVVAT
ncbi:MAG: proteasome subunit beta, partial [Halapricum sp.]